MKLSLKIGDEYLDMFPDTSIRFERVSPLSSGTSIEGDYSFPLNLPRSERNQRMLGYPEMPGNTLSPWTTYTVEVIAEGALHRTGTLRVRDAGTDGYQCSIIGDVGGARLTLEGISLRDLDLGVWETGTLVGTSGSASMAIKMAATLSGTAVTHPLVFFSLVDVNFLNYPDIWPLTGGEGTYNGYINYYIGGTFQGGWDDVNFGADDYVFPVPAIYVHHILRQIFAIGGHSISGTFMDDTEMQTLTLQGLYTLLERGEFGLPSKTRYRIPFPVADGCPDGYLCTEFVRDLRSLFNLGIWYDTATSTMRIDCIKDFVAAVSQGDWSRKVSPEWMVNFIEKEDSYSLAWVPDSLDLITKGNADPDIYNVLGEVNSWAGLPGGAATNDSYLVLAENSYYRWTGSFWTRYTRAWQNHTEEGSTSNVSSSIATMGMDVVTIGPREMIMPRCDQQGDAFLMVPYKPDKAWKGKLLFFRGLAPSSASGDYPLGSSGIFDRNANQVGNYSLTWDGEWGLYNTFWKAYIDAFNSGRVIKRMVRLSISEISMLDLKKKISIDSIDYLILNISYTITPTGVLPCEVTLLRA